MSRLAIPEMRSPAEAGGDSRPSVGLLFDTLRILVLRELRIRYKGSFFGVTWAVLSPLGTVVVLHFVFGQLLSIGTANFATFIYSALLPWAWFSTAVQSGASTLHDNRDLVRTPFFAKLLLPAVVVSTNFLLYLFALPVLLAMMAAGGIPLTSALLILPVIWAIHALLTLSVTVLVAAAGVLVRDVQHLMGVVLLFWFYLTPVFYSTDSVPPRYAEWLRLNPAGAIVEAHRAVTLFGRAPDWNALLACMAFALVLLAGSLALFRWLEDAFVEEA